ncbi:hypothetical protein NDU88_009735 [Pleurodeles waltl]|uniref:Uncharacterized protein n=1 Tax=Pleurodeles waltl TaxID=8319 RepID=A0AAV7RW30_PLEWA|nr:hypothetical protein NDU88_009735 [Pleurodeles waltl]
MKDKLPPMVSKQSTMDKYAQIGAFVPAAVAVTSDVPDNVTLLAAIKQSQDALEVQIGAVDSDINLLWQDLRKAVKRIAED